MKGYSGSTNFTFEIERYRDKETGDYLLLDAVPASSDDNFEFEYETISLEISGNSYYSPGKYHALPEDCYPDEGDTEIESVIGPDGKDWYNLLTDQERSHIIDMISENVSSGSDGRDDYDGDDGYDDDYYDPRWDNYSPY